MCFYEGILKDLPIVSNVILLVKWNPKALQDGSLLEIFPRKSNGWVDRLPSGK